MKKYRPMVFILLFITFLDAKELQKVSFIPQWLDQFQFAGYYMAKEKGFYEAVGLDVEIKKYQFKQVTVDEVASHRATYGVGRSALVVDRSEGVKIVLLAAVLQSSPLVLVSLKESGIKRVEDIRGKKIMGSFNDTSIASIQAMLQRFNIRQGDLNVIPYTYNIQDLIDSKTDLMTAYKTNQIYILNERGIEYNIFDPRDYNFDVYADILFTSEKELNENPQRVTNFTRASLKGWEYAFKNIDETIKIIMQKYNSQNKSYEALKYEAQELKKLAYLNTKKVGDIDIQKIQRIYDLYNVMGRVSGAINVKDFIISSYKHINLTQEEKKYLKSRAEVKFCTIPDAMPYSKIAKNEHIGMSADYINAVSKQINKKFTLIPTSSWAESIEFIKNKQCDIILLAQETLSRKKYLNFSTIVFSPSLVIATDMNKLFIPDIQNIQDKRLGISRGDSFIELVKIKYPQMNIVVVDNIEDGLEQVERGSIYGYIGDLASVTYEIQKRYAGTLKISGSMDDTVDVAIGVRNDDATLLNIINKAIDSISKEESQQIFNKWLNITYSNHVNYDLVIQLSTLFGVILLIIILFLLKQNRLKREIEVLAVSLEERVQEEVNKNLKKDKQMFYQSRLAQMGEMISMIAHQWRQPLGAISATSIDMKMQMELEKFNLDNMKEREEFYKYFKDRLNSIEIFTQSLTKTIDDFRDFYKQNRVMASINLKLPVTKALNIVKSSIKMNNIRLQENYNAQKEFAVFEGELIQVVLNILKNAEDNFKILKTKNAKITIRTEDTNDGVRISICNNGGGIDEAIIEKIFDPYFSTKHEKNGTGLGLYMSKMIVEEHHDGYIKAVNQNDGVCFYIEIKEKQ